MEGILFVIGMFTSPVTVLLGLVLLAIGACGILLVPRGFCRKHFPRFPHDGRCLSPIHAPPDTAPTAELQCRLSSLQER